MSNGEIVSHRKKKSYAEGRFVPIQTSHYGNVGAERVKNPQDFYEFDATTVAVATMTTASFIYKPLNLLSYKSVRDWR